ncbi:MAG: hypothetical protein ABFD97_02885 [Syntrophobacter sp.]
MDPRTHVNREHFNAHLSMLGAGMSLLERADRLPGTDPAERRTILDVIKSSLEGIDECITCPWADDEMVNTVSHSDVIAKAVNVCQTAGIIKRGE